MSKLDIGKRYSYKQNVYEIVNFGRMKQQDGQWIDAVGYRKVVYNEYKDEESLSNEVYTRERKSFEKLFIPRHLEEGDVLMGMSMGKNVVNLVVTKVENNFAICKYENGDGRGIVVSNCVSVNGLVNVDFDIKYNVPLEFYLVTDNIRGILHTKGIIEKIRSKLYHISEQFNKIDTTSVNYMYLDKYVKEIETLESRIKNDKSVWPQ